MKEELSNLIHQALITLTKQQTITDHPPIQIDRTKNKQHGDYASNIAMLLTKQAKIPPRQLAEKIIAELPKTDWIKKTEIAGPGFINFYITQTPLHNELKKILAQKEQYATSDTGQNEKIIIEYVSANPTGPLHVGHGRGAAYGASLANLLEKTGYQVHREYYVNDDGRQMDILATSIYLRYLQQCGQQTPFPTKGYQSEEYIYDIAKKLKEKHNDKLTIPTEKITKSLPKDGPNDEGEQHIDALMQRIKTLIPTKDYQQIIDAGLNHILTDIKQDLEEFGVTYQEWYSEKKLTQSNQIQQSLNLLKKTPYLYEKDGAQWFAASKLGDEKDRVLIRKNGENTYFAADIAYHIKKYQQGYDKIINIWGSDHHGYVARIKAALKALNYDDDRLEILLVQFANLYRNGQKVSMSTRSGQYVTLRELRKEIGNDAARYFYVLRRSAQHMDFDLDLAKKTSNENPMYYIQYTHARICSILKKLPEHGWTLDEQQGLNALPQLTHELEIQLLETLAYYKETIETAAQERAPHTLANYLRDLASAYHSCYNAQKVLVEEDTVRNARLTLGLAVKIIIADGLKILGVTAPEQM